MFSKGGKAKAKKSVKEGNNIVFCAILKTYNRIKSLIFYRNII